MPNKRLQGWISTVLILLLIALTGCQAVQGLDIGQALENSVNVKSIESKGSLELELVEGNTDQLSPREKALIQALKNTKITIKSAKLQDKQHASIDAELQYIKGTIPFRIVVDGTKIIIHIEGGKKPIVFDQTAFDADGAATPLSQEIQDKLAKSVEQLQPALIKFFVTNAPNPNKISVTSVSEQVNNETLSLQKAHVELNGSELTGLLKVFLTNILADEKGLKELLGQLYDVIIPIVKEQIKDMQSQSGEDTGGLNRIPVMQDLAMAYLDNKTLVVEFAYTTIQVFLKKAVDEFDKTMEDSISSPSASAQLQALLSDQTTLKADYYIDQDKQIRKSLLELHIPITEPDAGVSAIKLKAAFENWNIGKSVTASTIDTSGGVLNVDSDAFQGYAIVNNFDKNSLFYKLLKDDLNVTKKELHFIVESNNSYEDDDSLYGLTQPFINEDEVTMVPIRFLSEQLGAEVKWNPELKQVTIKDELNGTLIVMTVGSKTATVDGTGVALESAPALRNGATYVPIRFIAEKLGAKVEFDQDTQVVTITRD
ncbi:copper amine oxidase N-terminal domain-containing protein [Paenibacillus sedimenti]|uniref:Copper amine oxidase N-terminal domain-containing protein n=1 Tax=Paenibacillus sedimenti TaxID=2770274 RepID=A0A926KQ80_9BACL|nr:copper amine oxidase N-terminal domain-containing protein [Paenibacillus sedimenti]MBD0382039.1 copper amine oxidase N-terminal domain-containing protein [Paenibacillus sedimenti]